MRKVTLWCCDIHKNRPRSIYRHDICTCNDIACEKKSEGLLRSVAESNAKLCHRSTFTFKTTTQKALSKPLPNKQHNQTKNSNKPNCFTHLCNFLTKLTNSHFSENHRGSTSRSKLALSLTTKDCPSVDHSTTCSPLMHVVGLRAARVSDSITSIDFWGDVISC